MQTHIFTFPNTSLPPVTVIAETQTKAFQMAANELLMLIFPDNIPLEEDVIASAYSSISRLLLNAHMTSVPIANDEDAKGEIAFRTPIDTLRRMLLGSL